MFSLLTLSISPFLLSFFNWKKYFPLRKARCLHLEIFFLESEEKQLQSCQLSPPDGRGLCWECNAPSVETSRCVCPVLGLSPEVREYSRSKSSAKSALVACPLRVPEVTFLTSQNSLRHPKDLCLLLFGGFPALHPPSVTLSAKCSKCVLTSLATRSLSLRNGIFWTTKNLCHPFQLLFACLLLRGLWYIIS